MVTQPSLSEMFAYHATTMANTIRTSLVVFSRQVSLRSTLAGTVRDVWDAQACTAWPCTETGKPLTQGSAWPCFSKAHDVKEEEPHLLLLLLLLSSCTALS